ncbi:MAG: hypothetical protein AAGG48_25420 [Planctomycetota bacterium]
MGYSSRSCFTPKAFNIENPYEPPTNLETPRYDLKVRVPVSIRWMSGLMALTGAVFLPSVVLFIFIPGAIVWLFWSLNALGKPWANNPSFWWFSALWNSLWGIGLAVNTRSYSFAMLFLVGHWFAGVVLSCYALSFWRIAKARS